MLLDYDVMIVSKIAKIIYTLSHAYQCFWFLQDLPSGYIWMDGKRWNEEDCDVD